MKTMLILYAVGMGIKQGWAMLSAEPEKTKLFQTWGYSKTAMMALGALALLSAMLIVYPKTFLSGNFMMGTGIHLLLCLQLVSRDLKGAAIEFPFLMMNLLILYLGDPFTKTN